MNGWKIVGSAFTASVKLARGQHGIHQARSFIRGRTFKSRSEGRCQEDTNP